MTSAQEFGWSGLSAVNITECLHTSSKFEAGVLPYWLGGKLLKLQLGLFFNTTSFPQFYC